MNFAPPFHQVVETVVRRTLGGFQLVDAVTGLPTVTPARIEVREASFASAGDPIPVPLSTGSLQIQQTRSGLFAINRAPFFDNYTASFDNPANPPETPLGTSLRLRIAVVEAGPQYLPREFVVDLPRSLDRAAAENIYEPMLVELLRSPGALVLGGWSVVRVSVAQAGTNQSLPGVMVRVFASPRGAGDSPIGWGMSEWRGDLRGEALVAVADLARFRAGGGENVFETAQEVQLEATRDPTFTGMANQIPDLAILVAAAAPRIIRRRSDPPEPDFTLAPPTPLALRAGRETAVRLTMP